MTQKLKLEVGFIEILRPALSEKLITNHNNEVVSIKRIKIDKHIQFFNIANHNHKK